jgi:hypothetical protein
MMDFTPHRGDMRRGHADGFTNGVSNGFLFKSGVSNSVGPNSLSLSRSIGSTVDTRAESAVPESRGDKMRRIYAR